LAASRREPYARITTAAFRGWHQWLTTLIDAPTPELRSDEAAVFIAQIEGLMLMHLAGEPKMAQQAYCQFTSDGRSGR